MGPRKRSNFAKSLRTWSVIAVALLLVSYLIYMRYWLPRQASVDVFSLLQANGYTPNSEFSGLLRPGNIIQITELGEDHREHPLAVPLLFAWGDVCFAGQSPRTQEFTLPQGSGSTSAGLSVNRDAIGRLMPSLNLQSDAVADYSVRLENTRVQAFAKGDLSAHFSKECVSKLKTALDAGDKIEWFRLILSSVVADAVTLEVHWKQNSSADARARVTEDAKTTLSRTGASSNNSGLTVAITNNSENSTTISARGFVIIGYQARPMQPLVSHS